LPAPALSSSLFWTGETGSRCRSAQWFLTIP